MAEAQETKPWKTQAEVKKLTIGTKYLGSGAFGNVYVGRITFAGEKSKQVAVKRFYENMAPGYFNKVKFDDEVVGHYQEAIAKLRQEKVPVLKTGFVKHKGSIVQVQELYANSNGSKITEALQEVNVDPRIIQDPQTKKQLFDIIGGIINAGLNPHPDTIGVVQTSKGKRLVVHDLDFLAHINYAKPRNFFSVARDLNDRLMDWREKFNQAGVGSAEFLAELEKRVNRPEVLNEIRNLE